jgi:protein phosphatase PTC7
VTLEKKSGLLSTANLGDSGFLIYRDGSIIVRSKEQTHFFNAPYQCGIIPEADRAFSLADSPSSAIVAYVAQLYGAFRSY